MDHMNSGEGGGKYNETPRKIKFTHGLLSISDITECPKTSN